MKVKITNTITKVEVVEHNGTLEELQQSIETLNNFGKNKGSHYDYNVLD